MATPPPPLPPGWVLDQVVLLHRHGERSPVMEPFPDFPFVRSDGVRLCTRSDISRLRAGNGAYLVRYEDRELEDGRCAAVQLTDKGAATMEMFGRRLRAHYGNQVPMTYGGSAVQVRSTEIARAVYSSMSLLRGLFSDISSPIRIDVREERSEYLYPNFRTCPRFTHLTKQRVKANRDANATEEAAVRRILAPYINANMHVGMHALYDAVECGRSHNVPVPPVVDDALVARLEHLATRETWGHFHDDPQLCRLGSAKLLSSIADDVRDRALGGPVQLALYSAHDSSIVALIGSFDIKDRTWPPFASSLAFEVMHKESAAGPTAAKKEAKKEAVVRLSFDGKTLVMPECGAYADAATPELCPIQPFLKIMQGMVPKDLHAACAM